MADDTTYPYFVGSNPPSIRADMIPVVPNSPSTSGGNPATPIAVTVTGMTDWIHANPMLALGMAGIAAYFLFKKK